MKQWILNVSYKSSFMIQFNLNEMIRGKKTKKNNNLQLTAASISKSVVVSSTQLSYHTNIIRQKM